MPMKPKRNCKHPMCNKLIYGTYCDDHLIQHKQSINKRTHSNRADYHAWYSSARWRLLRINYLRLHPLCVRCDKPTAATVVDHIMPHKGNKELFWSVDNLQPLCKRCHDVKTATEDGGFGNKKG